ncbi:MAG: hypothetical protein RBT33_00840 [Candidatus Dojkabacteria bacterium]|nr:hypothetical protein [Candidatus Dojkabacteria bacterium]MDX9738899.1 hypothetical protein [Candidatus Dojkabacteria bacterium]
MPFIVLFNKMYSAINKASVSISASTVQVASEMQKPFFRALGLFTDTDELVGFITTYELTVDKIFCSGIYVEPEFRKSSLKLVRYMENEIRRLGYKTWHSEARTEEGKIFTLKLGATVDYIAYKKEL